MEVSVPNGNLRYIILVYAAIDRAQALGYPIPHKRVAAWTDDLSPCHFECTDWQQKLAEALLLASLVVFSGRNSTPYLEKCFPRDTACTWQNFLIMARDIIKRRGIVDGDDGDDPECGFLIRWFARLDVFGTFSDLSLGPPLPLDAYWPWDITKDLKVDYLLGTSSICTSILAKIANVLCRRRQSLNVRDCPVSERESLKLLLRTLESLKSPQMECLMCPGLSWAVSFNLMTISRILQATGKAYLKQLIGQRSYDTDVLTIASNVAGLAAKPSVNACIFLPMFVAGALTQDTVYLNLFRPDLERLERLGMERVSSPCLNSTPLVAE